MGFGGDRGDGAVAAHRAQDIDRDLFGGVAAALIEARDPGGTFSAWAPRMMLVRVIGVLIRPGQMVVTPILCRRISMRRASEKPNTANLVAE